MHGVLVATYSRHDLPYSSSSPPYRRQSQANIQRFVLPFSKRHTVNEHILNASGHEQKKEQHKSTKIRIVDFGKAESFTRWRHQRTTVTHFAVHFTFTKLAGI